MLSKCANPACLARFHYLHQGRIFNVEAWAIASDRSSSQRRRIEHFWLCEHCAQTLTVVIENGVVTTRPLHSGPPEGSPPDLKLGRQSF